MSSPKVAVVGAGVYGSTIALRLSRAGVQVDLYDPLGIMMGASSINQLRVHAGYHYPRSPETIKEVLECRKEFISEYKESIITGGKHYYAIPKDGSRISETDYVKVLDNFKLPHIEVKPDWMDFSYISSCWEVDEVLYNPDMMREIIQQRLKNSNIKYCSKKFERSKDENSYDFVAYATYGASASWMSLFKKLRIEIDFFVKV